MSAVETRWEHKHRGLWKECGCFSNVAYVTCVSFDDTVTSGYEHSPNWEINPAGSMNTAAVVERVNARALETKIVVWKWRRSVWRGNPFWLQAYIIKEGALTLRSRSVSVFFTPLVSKFRFSSSFFKSTTRKSASFRPSVSDAMVYESSNLLGEEVGSPRIGMDVRDDADGIVGWGSASRSSSHEVTWLFCRNGYAACAVWLEVIAGKRKPGSGANDLII